MIAALAISILALAVFSAVVYDVPLLAAALVPVGTIAILALLVAHLYFSARRADRRG